MAMAALVRAAALSVSTKQLHATTKVSSVLLRALSTSPVTLGRRVYVIGKDLSVSDLRPKIIDESDNETVNIDALAQSTAMAEAGTAEWAQFPDGDTLEQTFDGIKYKDLPYVTMICTYNNTKIWANAGDNRWLFYCCPRKYGFFHAKKRTNVAAQAAGLGMGQQLRSQNVRTVRVRVDGFNQGRIASIKGLVQAGLKVVSITDVTQVDWGWAQRAQKRKRVN